MEPMVLVLGNSGDWALAEVGKELDARGVRWELLNTADFPIRIDMDARLEPTGADWRGEFVTGEVRTPLVEVTAVYYGKPTDFELPTGLSGPELRFSRAQARVGVGGVLASLPVRWVSHPSALADASFKPQQLSRLHRAGLTTPPTLITNKAAAVRDFAASYGDLVIKPLAEPVVWEGGGESVIYTRRMTPADLDCLDGVESTAHLFQQWQEKKYEARVIAVDDQLFAVAIHADSDRAYVDWRADYDSLRYEVIDVPDHIRAGIFRYLDIAGLASSVFDFVIRPDRARGEWIVLEANAAGAWGWLAEECGLSIAAAFADTLTKE